MKSPPPLLLLPFVLSILLLLFLGFFECTPDAAPPPHEKDGPASAEVKPLKQGARLRSIGDAARSAEGGERKTENGRRASSPVK